MILMIKRANFLLLMSFLSAFSLFSAEKTENINTKTAVIFNTLCAVCHEGECSGRLSYDTGIKAVSPHIKHYAGDSNISESEIEELFTLLDYMKKECALLMPDSEKFKPENLSYFAISSYKGYFIPLGILENGNYRLIIEIKGDALFSMEVLSANLNHFFDRIFYPNHKEQVLRFTIDKPINAFLRIRSKEPLYIIALKIEKEDVQK
jgi:hypothetical protein